MTLSISSHACWPSVCLLWKMSIQVFCPFFHHVVCFSHVELYELFILDINPLWVTSLANLFSHSVGCFFILSMVSFAVKKLLSLIRYHLFIFAFISFALGNRFKKIAMIYVKECSAYVFF